MQLVYYVKGIVKIPNKKAKHSKSYFEVKEKCGVAVPLRARHPEVANLNLSAWLDRNIYFPGIFIFIFRFLFLFLFRFLPPPPHPRLTFITGDTVLIRLKANNTANAMTRNMQLSVRSSRLFTASRFSRILPRNLRLIADACC